MKTDVTTNVRAYLLEANIDINEMADCIGEDRGLFTEMLNTTLSAETFLEICMQLDKDPRFFG